MHYSLFTRRMTLLLMHHYIVGYYDYTASIYYVLAIKHLTVSLLWHSNELCVKLHTKLFIYLC